MDGMLAIYIFMLAAFVGYEIISKVPVILHTPLMSGSNFIHGVVVVGAMIALGHAETPLEIAIGFFAVALGAANAAGGYVVTERMLAMFKKKEPSEPKAGVNHEHSVLCAGGMVCRCFTVYFRFEGHEFANHGASRHCLGGRGYVGRDYRYVFGAASEQYWLDVAGLGDWRVCRVDFR